PPRTNNAGSQASVITQRGQVFRRDDSKRAIATLVIAHLARFSPTTPPSWYPQLRRTSKPQWRSTQKWSAAPKVYQSVTGGRHVWRIRSPVRRCHQKSVSLSGNRPSRNVSPRKRAARAASVPSAMSRAEVVGSALVL